MYSTRERGASQNVWWALPIAAIAMILDLPARQGLALELLWTTIRIEPGPYVLYLGCVTSGFILFRVIDGWFSRDFFTSLAGMGMTSYGYVFLYDVFFLYDTFDGSSSQTSFVFESNQEAEGIAMLLTGAGVISGLMFRKKLFSWLF